MLPLIGRPTFILIACQPKSASTFLTQAIANLPGFKSVGLVPGYDRREQELCEARLQRFRFRQGKLYVAQHHVRHSLPTQQLIDKYGICVVVLIRDLFDVVISLRDHVRKESPVGPMLYLDTAHPSLSDDALEQAIARLALPWYLNFYMSWRGVPGVTLVNYDDLLDQPRETVASICAQAGIGATADVIDRAIAGARGQTTRFNKGQRGRGQLLSQTTRNLILDLLALYPSARSDPYFRSMLDGTGG